MFDCSSNKHEHEHEQILPTGEGFIITEMWHQRSGNYKRLLKLLETGKSDKWGTCLSIEELFPRKRWCWQQQIQFSERGSEGAEWRMKREEDLIKTRRIPFVGGEFYIYSQLSEPGLKLSGQQSPERKSSPSCRLLAVPVARRRISPFLPTCPHRAERISMTFSAAPEQLIHDGSLTRSRSGRLLCYTAESQSEAERFVLIEFTQRVFFGCKWIQELRVQGDVP